MPMSLRQYSNDFTLAASAQLSSKRLSTIQQHSPRQEQVLGRVLALLCVVAASFGALSANPVITVCGLLLPALLWQMLWRAGHPAVLVFAAMFQWAQAFTPVLAANMEGKTLNEVFRGPELELAAWLSLGSVLALSMGMWCARRFTKQSLPARVIAEQSSALNISRLLTAYILASLFAFACTYVSSRAGGLRQPILAFAALKWYPIFLLAWTTLQRRHRYSPLIVVVLIEIALGFTGYFSSFKNVIFMLLVVGLGVTVNQGKVKIGPLLVSACVAAVLVMFWQSVKTDYRRFLNQGTGQQVVAVPVAERFVFLAEAVYQTTPESMWQGAISGLERLGYIEYLAYSIRSVPAHIPHENGELWIGALKHTFMPRLFFPGKPTLNESERTNRYTMLSVAGQDQGTAISLGYPAESYIDFGPVWMFVPIFLLGIVFSLIYEKLANWAPYHLSGVALATSLLVFSAHQLEMSNIKLVGGMGVGLIAFALFQKFAVPYIWPLLSNPAIRKDPY